MFEIEFVVFVRIRFNTSLVTARAKICWWNVYLLTEFLLEMFVERNGDISVLVVCDLENNCEIRIVVIRFDDGMCLARADFGTVS